MTKAKTKKKVTAKKITDGQRIVDYILDHVAAAGVVEGRRPNRKVFFTGVHVNKQGEMRPVYDKLVADIDSHLADLLRMGQGASKKAKKG